MNTAFHLLEGCAPARVVGSKTGDGVWCGGGWGVGGGGWVEWEGMAIV